MHQRKLAAQPRKYSTEEKKKWPSTYIPCPKCGVLMTKKSKQCLNCYKSEKKPAIQGSFLINGIECHLVVLTRELYTIVEDADYEFIMNWNWFAFKNENKYYALRNEYVGVKKQRLVQMHQVVLERKLGRPIRRGYCPDHINGCGIDNRRSNLREATPGQNRTNVGVRKVNTSGYIGVNWNSRTRRWQARVTVNGRRILAGNFHTAHAAAEARDEAAIEYQGEFAVLNFNYH